MLMFSFFPIAIFRCINNNLALFLLLIAYTVGNKMAILDCNEKDVNKQ